MTFRRYFSVIAYAPSQPGDSTADRSTEILPVNT
jgi:hypothetical protein